MKISAIAIDRATVKTVLGWNAGTKIAFKTGAQRGNEGNARACGGSKGDSAQGRFKKYSRAKTVGEAMNLGAMKADLVWDFHCGLVRVAAAQGGVGKFVKKTIAKKKARVQTEVTNAKALKEEWPAQEYVKEKKEAGKKGNSYCGETYLQVSRWKADTRIRYKPHAKAPGSKSHLRYEIYSKAVTVEEALKLGSYPIDWCWDYERGFIKVDEETTRDEPLCPGEDETDFTDVDRVVMQWWKYEMARSLGKSVKELNEDVGKYESLIIHMKRTVASKRAKKILDECKADGRAVSDEDIVEVLRAWPFKKNTTRLNVMQEGQTWVHSDTIGIIPTRDGRLLVTPATKDYPDFSRVINQYMRDHTPSDLGMDHFPFTSININKAYNGRLHRDGNNVGPSMLKAFGKFSGGELNYYPNDDRATKLEDLPKSDRIVVDVNKNLILFDGRRGHEVNNFKGERYSLVYFTAPRIWKAKADAIKSLKDRFFNVPTPASSKRCMKLLSAPSGYSSGKKLGSANKVRAWPLKTVGKQKQVRKTAFAKAPSGGA
jgi:hypothetical protein